MKKFITMGLLAVAVIGGAVQVQAEEAGAAAEGVKEAQAAWARLSPIAGADARALEGRFKDACRRVNDHAKRHAPAPSGPPRRPSSRPTAMTV